MSPDERKDLRLQLEVDLFNLQVKLGETKRGCKCHQIAKGRLMFSPRLNKVINTFEQGLIEYPNRFKDLRKGEWESVTMFCQICDEDFGWYCPKNPKGYCEYSDKGGEDCIHCGWPSERK